MDKCAYSGRERDGFSLLEVLIAIAIFSFGMLAVAHLQATTAKGNADARNVTNATKLVRSLMGNIDQPASFYMSVAGACGTSSFKLDNIGHTVVENALLDPEAVISKEADPLCPLAAQPDDLDLEAALNSTGKTELQVAQSSDRCLKRDNQNTTTCAPVDDMMNFDRGALMYWIAWNLRAGYPEKKMTSMRLYVFWRGMDGKRHWVKANALLTAKDMSYYQ